MWAKPTMNALQKLDVYDQIVEFIDMARRLVSEMQSRYECDKLLAGYRNKRIEKTGAVNETWDYCFHGAGCRFEYGDVLVDVEFGEDGRYDLCDAWRVFQFVSGKSEFANVVLEEIESGFRELQKDGKIIKVNETQFSVAAD